MDGFLTFTDDVFVAVEEGYKIIWKTNKADLNDPRVNKPVVVETTTTAKAPLKDDEISPNWVPEVGLVSFKYEINLCKVHLICY